MYKEQYSEGKLNGYIRLSDNAYIPMVEENMDYQAYLEWVAEGNTPDPAETTEEIATREQRETNASAIEYLAETDWYLLRELDGGVAMTTEMKTERAKRRLEVTRQPIEA